MLKLKKYLKPFIFPIILAICLLFLQAICDLNLPNLMSEIVNVGIQSRGVERATPEAISENGMKLMQTFMNEEEKNLIEASFYKVEQGDANYEKTYPNVKEKNIYVLKNELTEETIEKLDRAFEIATRTFINTMSAMAEQNGQASEAMQDKSNIDVEQIYSMLPYLASIDSATISKARQDAENMEESMLSQTAIAVTQLMYKELGMNLGKIQTIYLLKTGAKMLGMTIIVVLTAISVSFIATRVATKISRNLRKDVFEKVEQFSANEFDKFSTSSLITRTTNDINQVQNLIIMLIRVMAYAPIMGIGGVIMILQRNAGMSWILGIACVGILCLIGVIFALAMPKFKLLQKLTDKINLVSRESLSGIMVSRAFRTQKHEEERFDEVNKQIAKTNLFVNRVMVFMMPAMTLIMNAISVIIVWVGANQIAEANLMVGDMMAFMQYAMQVIMSFLMISMMFIMVPRASVSGTRIAEVLETEPSIKEPEQAKEFIEDKMGYVEFKNVSFKYQDAEENVLENISFTAKPGETTAFIGSTGSGKSTLIKLVPRFYDVTEGEILVNGVNVKDIEGHKLQEQIGYVPQKGSLLTGTIESNLKYGKPEASDELMKRSAEVAQATEFIDEKEEKYKSEISQGGKNVSGGQKQRLSIARALVKEAPIYIFDDSFSALDFKTDSALRQALKDYAKGSTILIVAQRVSTIMNAEQIIVLEDGKIVGKGTHKELLKNCKTYYEIAASQLEKEEL